VAHSLYSTGVGRPKSGVNRFYLANISQNFKNIFYCCAFYLIKVFLLMRLCRYVTVCGKDGLCQIFWSVHKRLCRSQSFRPAIAGSFFAGQNRSALVDKTDTQSWIYDVASQKRRMFEFSKETQPIRILCARSDGGLSADIARNASV
jgi:hypothetical protein